MRFSPAADTRIIRDKDTVFNHPLAAVQPLKWGERNGDMCRKLKCLIVEDDAASVIITKWELASKGLWFDCDHVDNAAQMRQSLQDKKFDIIISDHHMPAFSSLDALQIRNDMVPGIPFIVLSLNIPEAEEKAILRQGGSAVLYKERIGLLAGVIIQLIYGTDALHTKTIITH